MKLDYASYFLFIAVGIFMAIGTFLKLIGFVYIDSDWFWFLAGCGLAIEGTISLFKQKRFDRKYQIIEKQSTIKFKN